MKTAFVLSGGGAKGSYQAGVLYQLSNKGIVPNVIYGTSVGAINGAAMSYLSAEEIKEMWLTLKDNEVIWPTGFMKYLCWPKVLFSGGFYSLEPLENSLKKLFAGKIHNIESQSCYVDLKSGEAVYCSNFKVSQDEYIKSVLASSAIPMLMEDQNYAVDGGVRHHTPIEKAIEDGADIIYVILCRPYSITLPTWEPAKKLPRILEVGFRAIDDIMSHEIFLNDIWRLLHYNKHYEYFKMKKIEFHLYAPDRFWMDTVEFDPTKIQNAFEAGSLSTEIAL